MSSFFALFGSREVCGEVMDWEGRLGGERESGVFSGQTGPHLMSLLDESHRHRQMAWKSAVHALTVPGVLFFCNEGMDLSHHGDRGGSLLDE